MATDIPSYDQERTNKAAGTGGLTGALSGAATGATIGSALPGPGTAIGAAIGAIAGGLVGAGVGGTQEDTAQKAEIKSAKAAAKADTDLAIDTKAMAKQAMGGTSTAAYDETLSLAGAPSGYGGMTAYDAWKRAPFGG